MFPDIPKVKITPVAVWKQYEATLPQVDISFRASNRTWQSVCLSIRSFLKLKFVIGNSYEFKVQLHVPTLPKMVNHG
jgi:hypothetical protein